ncbi:MAG: DUF4838 domain-containing protein [Kiritimatiellia bacterium]
MHLSTQKLATAALGVLASLNLLAFWPFGQSADEPFVLAEDGKARAAIVCAKDAPKGYRYAATELADFLGRMTGGRFAVVDRPVKGLNTILIGADHQVRSDDELYIKVNSPREMVITGDGAIGTLYGVYDLLEQFGCGFYFHDWDYVPQTNRLELAAGYEKRDAPFCIRRSGWSQIERHEHAYNFKVRAHGDNRTQLPQMGFEPYKARGQIAQTLCTYFLSRKKYFKDHPEFYSYQRATGKRDGHWPCASSEKMYEALFKDIEEHIQKNPGEEEIAIGADDGVLRCECDNCLKLTALDNDGTGIPTSAMQYIEIMNRIGRHFKNKYPRLRFNMLAYGNTDRAPVHYEKYRLEPNVGVGVALLWKNHCRATYSCERAQRTVADWSKMVDPKVGIYNWDYYACFASYLIPFPNYDILGPNFRYYADLNHRGFYSQMQFTFDGDLMELHYWLYAKLCWNPYADAEALIDEYCRNAYGKQAGPLIREYIDRLTYAKERQIGAYYGCYVMETDHYLTSEDCYRIFKIAQQLDRIADDRNMPEVRRTILKRATIGMKLLTVIRYNDIKAVADKRKDQSLPPRTEALSNFRAATEHGENRRGQDWCELLGTWERFKGMVHYKGKTAVPAPKVPSLVLGADRLTGGTRMKVAENAADGKFCRIDTDFTNEDEYQVYMNPGNAEVGYSLKPEETGWWYIFSRLRCATRAESDPAVAYLGAYENYSQDGYFPGAKENGGWGREYAQQIAELKVPGGKAETTWSTRCLGRFNLKPSARVWAMVGIGSKLDFVDVKNFALVDPAVVDAALSLGNPTGTKGRFSKPKNAIDGFHYARLELAGATNSAERAAAEIVRPFGDKELGEKAVLVELLVNTDKPLDTRAVRLQVVKPAAQKGGEETILAEQFVMGNAGEEAYQIAVFDPLKIEKGVFLRIRQGDGAPVKGISLKRAGTLEKALLGF